MLCSMRRPLIACLASGLCSVALLASVPAAAPPERADVNWPQWRGPGGLGISAERDYVEVWGPDTNIAWKTPVPGRGHSSPIVWGDRLFITTSIEGAQVPGRTAPDHLDFKFQPGYLHPDSVGVDYRNTLKVLAYDTRTGRLLWERTAFSGLMYDNRHRRNTYASPSVVTDGSAVYAFFEAAGLYAYDMDGKLLWKRAPSEKGGELSWEESLGPIAKAGLGPGTSPILHEDLLILQVDQEMGADSAILALDKRTGAQVWKTERNNRRSWATPIIVRAGDRLELIASGAESVRAYDPRTGRELWHSRGTQSHPIPSPVAGHGLVYLTAGSGQKRTLAFRPGMNGDVVNENVAWAYDRGAPYVPSPLLLGRYLYLMTERGQTTCLDALTGELLYEGRPPVPATFMASMVGFGERILQVSEDGDTFVLKAGPEHEILRTNSLDEPIFASPALANGTIYLRGEQHLYAIRK
jgi:outer membrane protein assembly factor BamB